MNILAFNLAANHVSFQAIPKNDLMHFTPSRLTFDGYGK